jgi:hypothetical protein
MTSVMELTRADAAARRNDIRTQLGRKTAAEIRVWASDINDRAWALTIAGRLAVSGFLTLADVTDDEFDSIAA